MAPSATTSNGLHASSQRSHAEKFERPISAAERLRNLLASPTSITACPGVFDGISARLAILQGFPCLYMTGAGTAAARTGLPDLGMITMTEMLTNASMIAGLDRTVPVIADADTGYGGPNMVARTVKGYIAGGVAGMHIEDQVIMKRCGHLGGKELVSREEYFGRIKAAVMARDEERRVTGGDVVLIARTDALQSFGFDEAVARLRGCVELGADAVFLEGVRSVEEAKKFNEMFKDVPTLLNNVPGGVTPDMTVDEARQLGYRIVIYPGLGLNAVVQSVTASYKGLYEQGNVHISEDQHKAGVKQLFNAMGLQECMAFDAAAGGTSYSKGV